jgi:hypothetical protein
MKKIAFPIACAVMVIALSSCASMMRHWTKPGASLAQQNQDQQECTYEAAKATASIQDGFAAGWQQANLESQCMAVRGYALR